MINLIVFSILTIIVLSFLLILMFDPISLANSTIIVMVISGLILYAASKYKDIYEEKEDKLVSHSLKLLVLFIIISLIEYFYMYGLNEAKSIIMILVILTICIVGFSLFMYLRN